MKTLLLNVVLLFAISAFSQQIKFETTSYDFGQVNEEGGPKECVFLFKNLDKQALLVTNVQTSCGCASSEYTKTEVKKGKSGEVKVIFNPINRPGSFTKTITVTTNSKDAAVQVLTITGTVVPKPKSKDEIYRLKLGLLKADKDRVNMLKVSNKSTGYDTIKVYNDSDTLQAISFSKVPDYIKVTAEPATLNPKQEGIIVVAFDALAKNDFGYIRDRVYIDFNGVEDMKHRIYISADIIEDFASWTPEELANAAVIKFNETVFEFDTISQGESVSTKFEFTNEGKSDLIIRKTKASCGCTASKPTKDTIAPGETSEINVTFNSRGKRGKQNKSITIISNDPNNSQFNLYIRGFVTVPEVQQH